MAAAWAAFRRGLRRIEAVLARRAIKPQVTRRVTVPQHVKENKPGERNEEAEEGHAFHQDSPCCPGRSPARKATRVPHHHQKDQPLFVRRAVCAEAVCETSDRAPEVVIAVMRYV